MKSIDGRADDFCETSATVGGSVHLRGSSQMPALNILRIPNGSSYVVSPKAALKNYFYSKC